MSELTVGDSYVISRQHLIEAIEYCIEESHSPAELADAILARLQGRKIMTVERRGGSWVQDVSSGAPVTSDPDQPVIEVKDPQW